MFAIPPGMTDEQLQQALGEPAPEPAPAPAPAPEPAPEPVTAAEPDPPKPERKRARDENGRLKGDDPATPQNEAWVETAT